MNVLNFDMFGLKDIDGNTISRGLVELKFGKEGITTAAGTGGVNMSYNAIKGAIEGFDTFATQQKIRYYEATGKTDFADDYTGTKKVGTSLRMNYSFGDGKQIGQLNSILEGTDTLRVGYISQDGYTKKIGGGREVNLATLGTDSDINTRLKAGIVLGHEAYRDGIEGTEKEQFYESVNATAAHTAMALRVAGEYGYDFITSDANLSADVFNYAKDAADFEQYVFDNYNWRGENWKLMNDGSIKYDGKRGLYDENGDFIRLATDENGMTLGYGESLLEYMGRENAEAVAQQYGENTSGMSNSELGDALMSCLPLEWTATGVPKDANMNEMLTLPYQKGKKAWLGNSYQKSTTMANFLKAEFGTSNPTFMASQDVLDQVAKRNSILSMMSTYKNAIENGYGSPSTLGKYETMITKMQGEYNREYVKSGLAFTPENYISQEFRNALNRYKLDDGKYITYKHSGIDTVGNSQVYSSGFMGIVAGIPSKYEKTYAEEFTLIGTDIHFRALHLNPAQVNKISGNSTYIPGQEIAEYGMWGPTGGPHLHLEMTFLNEQEIRGFGNPLQVNNSNWYPSTDFYGKYEKQIRPGIFKIIKNKGWTSTYPR